MKNFQLMCLRTFCLICANFKCSFLLYFWNWNNEKPIMSAIAYLVWILYFVTRTSNFRSVFPLCPWYFWCAVYAERPIHFCFFLCIGEKRKRRFFLFNFFFLFLYANNLSRHFTCNNEAMENFPLGSIHFSFFNEYFKALSICKILPPTQNWCDAVWCELMESFLFVVLNKMRCELVVTKTILKRFQYT